MERPKATTLATGERVIAASKRADGSIRKEVKIRPGFKSAELDDPETRKYKPRALRNATDLQTLPGKSSPSPSKAPAKKRSGWDDDEGSSASPAGRSGAGAVARSDGKSWRTAQQTAAVAGAGASAGEDASLAAQLAKLDIISDADSAKPASASTAAEDKPASGDAAVACSAAAPGDEGSDGSKAVLDSS